MRTLPRSKTTVVGMSPVCAVMAPASLKGGSVRTHATWASGFRAWKKRPSAAHGRRVRSLGRCRCAAEGRCVSQKSRMRLTEVSEAADASRLQSLSTHLGVEFDILTLGELAVAGGFDRGEVGEDICRTVVRLDESETLFRVEPFHGTCSHNLCILIFQLMTASAVLMVGSVTGSGFPVGWTESWDAGPTKICGAPRLPGLEPSTACAGGQSMTEMKTGNSRYR